MPEDLSVIQENIAEYIARLAQPGPVPKGMQELLERVEADEVVFSDGTRPTANRSWWAEKLRANRERDADTTRLLEDAGWTVLRIWEHTSASDAADLVERFLDAGPAAARTTPDPVRPV